VECLYPVLAWVAGWQGSRVAGVSYVGVRNKHGSILLTVNEQHLRSLCQALDQRDRREWIEASALRPLEAGGATEPHFPRVGNGKV